MDTQVPTDPSTTLSEAISSARRHIRAGDLPAAAVTLNGPLASLDPGRPTPELIEEVIEAGSLFAYALAGCRELGFALQWATWAVQASQRTYRPGDPRTVLPTQVQAQLLAATGNTMTAIAAYQQLASTLTALDGPAGRRTLCARADLATALHRAGDCLTAHTTLAEAWDALRAAYGDRYLTAIRMCARLATMYRDCADPDQAEQHFALARYYAADSPAATAMVTRTAARIADPTHRVVCTHTPSPARIHRPPARPAP